MKVFILISVVLFPVFLFSHQPVMDMAPRWEGGYGIQTRYAVKKKDTLIHGRTRQSNPLGLSSKTNTLWVEGVYTFTLKRRLTLKLPYLSKTDTRSASPDTTETLHRHGLGDVIIGFLNKWYFNKPGLTGNVSFTPSLKLPTGTAHGPLMIGSGTIDYGLSLSASIEAFRFYGLWDLFTWGHSTQDTGIRTGTIIGFDSDWGIHPYHDMDKNMGIFAMIGLNARHYNPDSGPGNVDRHTGGKTLEIVPTLIGYKDSLMIKAMYHIPIYANLNGIQLAPSSGFQLGVGAAF